MIEEEVFGQFFDSCRMCPFADSDGKQMLVQNQDVSAFNSGREGAFIVKRNILLSVKGVKFKNIVAINGFAASGRCVHFADDDAVTDYTERIAGKIEIRHWIGNKRIVANVIG